MHDEDGSEGFNGGGHRLELDQPSETALIGKMIGVHTSLAALRSQ